MVRHYFRCYAAAGRTWLPFLPTLTSPRADKTLCHGFASVLVENFGDAHARALPLKRLGEPQDIANLAVFLASDLAGWITGDTFVIDGGSGVAAGMA